LSFNSKLTEPFFFKEISAASKTLKTFNPSSPEVRGFLFSIMEFKKCWHSFFKGSTSVNSTAIGLDFSITGKLFSQDKLLLIRLRRLWSCWENPKNR
jgi:hypothetical protein